VLLHVASLLYSYVTNKGRYVFAQTLLLSLVQNVVIYRELSVFVMVMIKFIVVFCLFWFERPAVNADLLYLFNGSVRSWKAS
jgi:hypothetical protein